jgi:hypothetical protein
VINTYLTEAKIKASQNCCVPDGDYESLDCPVTSVSNDLSCGPYRNYGEIYSRCCNGSNLAGYVLHCDEAGITLVSDPCQESYRCVEHDGIIGTGQIGIYAQCELIDL